MAAVLLGADRCVLCGVAEAAVCRWCLAEDAARPVSPPLHLDRCTALLDYHLARPVITKLKNGQQRSLLGPLAAALSHRAQPPPDAVVTWAPTTPERARQRGFDQAELLARALARRWGLPARSLLRRAPHTAQAGRTAGDRLRTPTFRVAGRVPPVVVLVDDVVTTGATLTAAARALRAAGAAQVVGAALAQADRQPAAR